MHNDMDEIKNQWRKAKESIPHEGSLDTLIKTAESRKRSAVAFHYGNIIALTFLVAILVLLFLFVFPFQETISRMGVACMVGSIVLRIVIEFYSSVKAKQINLASTTSTATVQTLKFYEFRKKIHGPITISIVALYTVGLALLTGEFHTHIGPIIYLFDGLYCMGGIFIIWQIRKGIRKEMNDLKEIIRIRTQFNA